MPATWTITARAAAAVGVAAAPDRAASALLSAPSTPRSAEGVGAVPRPVAASTAGKPRLTSRVRLTGVVTFSPGSENVHVLEEGM